MSWTFWKPNTPTNLTGSLVAGGSLDANTTYYFKVFAWDSGNTTTTRTTVTQQNRQVLSAYSATFSITTDATNRSVALTWDQVVKRNGTTQVDAYEVIISKADDFDTSKDTALLSQSAYFYPTSYTNSATITSNPNVAVKNTKDGLPLMEWDGASSASFESLYTALKADATYKDFARSLTSFQDATDIYIYQFMGTIYIKRWAGDTTAGSYSFVSLGNIVQINGGLEFESMKYRICDTVISVNGSTHRNQMYSAPLSGSIITSNYFKGGTRQYINKSYTSNASGPANFMSTYPSTQISANINQISENTGESISDGSTFISTPWYPIASTGVSTMVRARLDMRGSRLDNYIAQAISGIFKKIYFIDPFLGVYPCGFYWATESTFSANNYGIYYQPTEFSVGHYDCRYIYTDRAGWDIVGALKKNDIMYFGKTIRLKIVDTEGNPIQGAKVSFLSQAGINLTKGNSESTICKSVSGSTSTGNNYDSTEATFKHNDPWVIVRHNAGPYGYSTLKDNTMYWFRGEKILVGTGTLEPYGSSLYKYTATRGVDGTPVTWSMGGNTVATDCYYESLDYVETDSNGFTFNNVIGKTYKALVATGSAMMSSLVTTGKIEVYNNFPIEIRVEADGYQTKSIILDETTAIDLGLQAVNILLTLENKIGVITAINEDRLIINIDPKNAKNMSGFMLLD